MPALAVVGIVIPLTADRLTRLADQNAVALAQLPVEILHPVLLAAEKLRDRVTFGIEMLTVVHRQLQAGFGGERPKFFIQSPFVRQLIGDGLTVILGEPFTQQLDKRQPARRFTDAHVMDAVAGLLQGTCECAHAGEKRQQLLGVVFDVMAFLPQLGHQVQDIIAPLSEPGMAGMQLIAEDQPDFTNGGHRYAPEVQWPSDRYDRHRNSISPRP